MKKFLQWSLMMTAIVVISSCSGKLETPDKTPPASKASDAGEDGQLLTKAYFDEYYYGGSSYYYDHLELYMGPYTNYCAKIEVSKGLLCSVSIADMVEKAIRAKYGPDLMSVSSVTEYFPKASYMTETVTVSLNKDEDFPVNNAYYDVKLSDGTEMFIEAEGYGLMSFGLQIDPNYRYIYAGESYGELYVPNSQKGVQYILSLNGTRVGDPWISTWGGDHYWDVHIPGVYTVSANYPGYEGIEMTIEFIP